jgi:hypothetical protein
MALSALPRHYEAISLYRALDFEFDDRPREPGNSDEAMLMKLDPGDPDNGPATGK